MATTPIPAPQEVTNPSPVDLETPEQKYARLYSQAPQVQAPQTSPVTSPAPQALSPEITETLSALRQELAELRARTPQAPQTPTPAPVGWVEKIRQGDFEGAEKALTETVRSQIIREVEDQAFQKSTAATQVQLAIDRHLTQVRLTNPDLARFERYLEAPVNTRVEAARVAGRIRSSDDFVREYKSAVDAEVLELRNLGLQYRAEGATQAMTRQQTVQNAFTPPPQQVGDHTTPNPALSQQGESTEDYFTRRQASGARLRNL